MQSRGRVGLGWVRLIFAIWSVVGFALDRQGGRVRLMFAILSVVGFALDRQGRRGALDRQGRRVCLAFKEAAKACWGCPWPTLRPVLANYCLHPFHCTSTALLAESVAQLRVPCRLLLPL